MKVIKELIISAILIVVSIGLIAIGNGHTRYKEALKEANLSEKIESIRNREDYTELKNIPQIYIDAVISVEDHRFYKHGGIDIIAIARAMLYDIKTMSFEQRWKYNNSTISKEFILYTRKKVSKKDCRSIYGI